MVWSDLGGFDPFGFGSVRYGCRDKAWLGPTTHV